VSSGLEILSSCEIKKTKEFVMSGRRSDWCKNYRGMHLKEACESGVRFDSLPNHGTKQFFDSCPCFSREATGCDKAQYRTPEEIAADEERLKKRFEGMAMAREAIVESCGGPWKRGMQGVANTINCPVCSGKETLRYSRSGYNGHIHAACTTEGCVRWME
jgi:hypothetical protein